MKLSEMRRDSKPVAVVVAFWLSYAGVMAGLFVWLGLGAAITWLSLTVFVLCLLILA